MASSSQSRKSRKPKKTKKPRATHFKKKLIRSKNKAFDDHIPSSPRHEPPQPEGLECSLSSTTSSLVNEEDAESGCSTPKAHRFQIPEIATCPPAPKKQRVMRNCTLRRRPIALFAPPDIELFFYFALGERVN